MKFNISLGNDNLLSAMRRFGYAPDGVGEKTAELRFFRSLAQRRYPRFHLYCKEEDENAFCSLHLDQKQPSYKGTSAHSGEYEGLLVEQEVQRILALPNQR